MSTHQPPLPKPLAVLRRERTWPKDVPLPVAGAFKAGQPRNYADEQLLRRYYPTYGTKYCAQYLGRTHTVVRARAGRLGISNTTRRPWAKADDAKMAETLGRTHPHVET